MIGFISIMPQHQACRLSHTIHINFTLRKLYAPTYSFWPIRSMLISLFRGPCWFDTVCNIVTRWMNIRKKQLHEHELQLSDYNIQKYFCPNVQIFGRKKYIYNFCLWTFQGQNEKLYTRKNTYNLGQNTSKYCSQIIIDHVHANGFL